MRAVWPVKSRQVSIKIAQNESIRKMKDFYTFTKIAENMGDLAKISASTGLEKLPKVH